MDVYNSLVQYYLNGTSTSYNIEALAGVSSSNSGYYNGYQALGDLYFDFGHGSSSNDTRVLDLEDGVSTVDYTYNSVSYSRKYFASNPENVIVSHFEADSNGSLSFTVSFTSKQNASNTASVDDGVGYISIAGTVSNNGLLHNTQIAVVSDGTVSVSGTSITVSGATTATVYLTAAIDYENTFYNDDESIEYYYRTGETEDELNVRVKEVLDDAVSAGYEKILDRHTSDYKELYDRVNLDLGQSNSLTTDALLDAYQNGTATAAQARYLEVLLFQYGRYLLIAGSRETASCLPPYRASGTTITRLLGIPISIQTSIWK